MRFVKTGAVALAFAGAAVLGSGVAHADETITVTAELLGCSIQNQVGVDALANVQPGTSVTVSNEVFADLKAKGCLPG
ncbi:hypothetical protein [Nocardia mexicana]|uniref:Small secreted domain DUF320 n=1 Tax=Nocardia mexicana TaxID=279262 RepID=A0A370GM91_9NOCA|nr:hypothetical protein [Nocardia mexicana]RDI44480.1 hypothetical protein DFR68_11797 [Nocardia mexicana]